MEILVAAILPGKSKDCLLLTGRGLKTGKMVKYCADKTNRVVSIIADWWWALSGGR